MAVIENDYAAYIQTPDGEVPIRDLDAQKKIDSLSEEIADNLGYKEYEENLFVGDAINTGKYALNKNAIGSDVEISANSKYSYIKIPVLAGEKYAINTYCVQQSYANVGICLFVDSNEKTLDNSKWITIGNNSEIFDSLENELLVEAPENANYMYINGYSDTYDFGNFKVRKFVENIGIVYEKIGELNDKKLNKNAGVENSGKFLSVDEDGNIDFKDLESSEGIEILNTKKDYFYDSENLIDLSVSNTSDLGYEIIGLDNSLLSVTKPGLKKVGESFTVSTPVDRGFSIDFWFTGTNFEVVGNGKTTRILVAVDDKIISNLSFFDENYLKTYTKCNFEDNSKKHITIFIFGRCYGIVADTSEITKYNKNYPLCCFEGDSITEGAAIITSGNSPAYSYPARICQKFGWDLYNAAIGGSGYINGGNSGQPNMVDRFETNIVPYQPDVFICCAGLNDPTGDQEALKTSIDLYWSKVKNDLNTKNIIAISPFNPSPTILESLQIATGFIKEACKNNKIPFIDIINNKAYDAMGNLLSTNDESIITEENVSSCIGDGTHLTKDGHIRMADKLSIIIWQILKNEFGLL